MACPRSPNPQPLQFTQFFAGMAFGSWRLSVGQKYFLAIGMKRPERPTVVAIANLCAMD